MPPALRILALLVALTLSSLPGLGAQQTRSIRIMPRMGLLSPDTYFYEQYLHFAEDEPTEWSTGSLGRAFVAGLGIEVGFGDTPVLLRGEIVRSFRTWLSLVHSEVVPRQFFDPPTVRSTWIDVPANLTFTSLQIVLPTRLSLAGVQPYVFGGVGGRFYEFGAPQPGNDVGAVLPEEGFTWGGDVGAGFTVEFAGATWDFQARDSFSRYWAKAQNDFLFTGALGIPLR